MSTGEPNARSAPPPFSVLLFLVGLVLGPVINFFMNLSGYGSSYQPQTILVAWLLTAGIVFLTFKLSYWLGWGLLGGFAALFLLLLVTGGIFGPYSCFGVYGYPRS